MAILLVAGGARADKPPPLSPQTLTLPNGPTALHGLGESFAPNIAVGGGSYGVPLQLPPSILAPKLTLAYTSGGGRTELGVGFSLPVLQIYRTTDKGLPDFDENDRFAVRGGDLNDELVLVDSAARAYRLKNEGAFALFTRDARADGWTIELPNGEKLFAGATVDSRQANGRGTYRWFIARHQDRFGHAITYHYAPYLGHHYLVEVRYQLHAPVEVQNRVAFNYEFRRDGAIDYTYGEIETTALRLQAIEVSHGPRLLRTYRLGYEERDLFSLLASVTLEGEHGELMPTLTFGYAAPQALPAMTVMTRPPPLEGLLSGQATLEDVNGDALPDLLYGVAGDYRYYENIDGEAWAAGAVVVGGSPDRNLADVDVLLADANGDGFRDIVHAHDDYFRVYPAGKVVEGVFSGYGAPIDLQTPGPLGFHWSSPGVQPVDLNRDGRTDLLVQGAGQPYQVVNGKDNWLSLSYVPPLPADADLTHPDVQLLDFNGDGHLDLVRKEIAPSSGRVRVWFGLGHGRYTGEKRMANVPVGGREEFYLVDINHDGQSDLLRVSGPQVSYQLNDGRLVFTAVQRVFGGAPSTGDTLRVLLADMNGNGSTDVVWITRDYKLRYLDLLVQPFAGLLDHIDNGMGAVSTITYRTSTEYMIDSKLAGAPWKTPMAAPMPVVAQVSTTDSFDVLGLAPTVTRVRYAYRDGYYDGIEREFRGFAQVTATEVGDVRHPTQVTEISMHVGRNLQTGVDEEILKGKRHRELVRTAAGLLVRSIEQRWERRWLCRDLQAVGRRILPTCVDFPDKDESKDSLVALAVLTAALEGSWEGTGSPRYTYVELGYDAFGNQTHKDAYGEVRFAVPRSVGAPFSRAEMDVGVGSDEVFATTVFINNPDEWLIGLVQSTELASGSGEVLRAGRRYYDGPDFVGLPLGLALVGKVSRKEAWLAEAGGGRWISTERFAYDAHGQPVAMLDALGNRRELGYDPETGSFAVEERIAVESGALVFGVGYDRGLGVVTEAIDFNNNPTRFLYDGLARLKAIIAPLTSEAEPLARFKYQFGTPERPVSVTEVEDLAERGAGVYNRRWVYSDGRGRQRLVKSQAEAPLGFVGSGFTDLSARGADVAAYRPFASAISGFEAPPADTPVTVSELDVLGRPVRVYAPATADGLTHTLTQYLPFEARAYDERDTSEGNLSYPAISRLDGLGRVVEVVKHNDYGGAFTELVWRAGYNAAGDIVSITDPGGHVRAYLYDTLGRLSFINDPNAGTVGLIYDDAGNLRSRVDALGQEVAFTYGAANRLTARNVRGDFYGEPDYRYVFHYDAAGPELAGARNLRGAVAWVESPVGSVLWSYDERGRTETTLQTLRDPVIPELPPAVYREDVTYDPQGRILSVSLPGGMRTVQTHNARGLLSEVSATRDGLRTYGVRQAFDAAGLLVRRDFANGQTTCLWRDARDRVSETRTATLGSQACGGAGTPLPVAAQHLAYDMRPEGMLDAIFDLSPSRPAVPRLDATFAYDRLYELTSAAWAEGSIGYTYDRIQNLVSRSVQIPWSGLPSGDLVYGERAGPNAVTSAFGERYRYDAAGRMQNFGGKALRFDAENRLSEATYAEGSRLTWQYDFNGDRRLKLSEEPGGVARQYRYPFSAYEERAGAPAWTLWANGERVGEVTEVRKPVPGLYLLEHLVLAEHDASAPQPLPSELWDHDVAGAAQRYWTEQPSGPAVEVVRYYHADHLSGPTHVTDGAGALVSLSRWYPYGSTWTELGWQPNRTFTGAEREAEADLGLIQMGARWYAPALGRWASADPFYLQDPRKGLASVLELNLYGYAGNNPIQFVDPQGLAITPYAIAEFPAGGSVAVNDIIQTDAFTIAPNVFEDGATRYIAYNKSLDANAYVITTDKDLDAFLRHEGMFDFYAWMGVEGPKYGADSAKFVLAALAGEWSAAASYYGDALTGAFSDPGYLALLAGSVAPGPKSATKGAAGKGLTTPKEYFKNTTKAQAEKALESKYGPPKSTRGHAKTYYNEKAGRSYNVHEQPGHQGGKPHVDVRTRGNLPERKFDLAEE